MNANPASTLPVALIPAYKPEPSVVETARQLFESGEFSGVVVINDGSGSEYDPLFQHIEALGATVLRHYTNQIGRAHV